MSDAIGGEHQHDAVIGRQPIGGRSYYCSGHRRSTRAERAAGAVTARGRRSGVYTALVVSVALQPIMARAQAALERGRRRRGDTAPRAGAALDVAHTRRRTGDPGRARRSLAPAGRFTQASAALGRPPDTLRETVAAGHSSPISGACTDGSPRRAAISRAPSRCTAGRSGMPSRRTTRAPSASRTSSWPAATSSSATAPTMREHFGEAASALHAVGDRRNLALVHSLSGSALAQTGTLRRGARPRMRQAERLAAAGPRRRRARDRLRQPGERGDDAASLRAGAGAGRAQRRAARAVSARATAWRWRSRPSARSASSSARCARAEAVLQRALEVRRALLFHETTGAIFDSLAQIHLMRGDVRPGGGVACGNAREAYGAYGEQTPRWYDWSLRLLEARLASRRGLFDDAVARSPTRSSRRRASRRPTMLHAQLIAVEALLDGGRTRRGRTSGSRRSARQLDARTTPGAWGEFLRVRARVARRSRARAADGVPRPGAEQQRVRAARRALRGRPQPPRARATGRARRAPARSDGAISIRPAATFAALGAARDLEDVEAARDAAGTGPGTGEFIGSQRRCRRSRGPARRGRGGAAGTAGARNRGRRAGSDARRRSSCCSSSRPAAASRASSRTSAARPTAPARSRAARRRPSRPAACSCSTDSGPSPMDAA